MTDAELIAIDVEAWSPPAYDVLEADLREAGFEPTLSEPRALVASATPVEIAAIYLAVSVRQAVVDKLVGAVIDWLMHVREPLRDDVDELVVPLLGPDGEVLREVRVPTRD